MKIHQKRRIFITILTLTFLLLLLTVRLGYIQLVMKNRAVPASGTRSLQQMSLLQRQRGIVLDTGRGGFYDRNGDPLTGGSIPAAVFFPFQTSQIIEAAARDMTKAATILGYEADEFQEMWKRLKGPEIHLKQNGSGQPVQLSLSQAEELSDLKLKSIRVLPYELRYKNELSGMQWLGYISNYQAVLTQQGVTLPRGASGLEKTLDPLLRGAGPTIAYYSVDGKNRTLPGSVMVKAPRNPYYPLRFITTIDAGIQRRVERTAGRLGIEEGAVVVLDAQNADVLAMTSFPFFNPTDIKLGEGAWGNKAVEAVVPGSIFKTVIAAAALENHLTSRTEEFYCTGHYSKYGLSCWKKEGHGKLNLEEAFAQSCNVVFATLGERLTAQQIQFAADKLGLGRRIGWSGQHMLGMKELRVLDHEQPGTIFHVGSRADGGVLAQTAIGQRDVTVTPLQAANLIVTLLNHGRVMEPRMLKQIEYANGQMMAELPGHQAEGSERIKSSTAKQILKWMDAVVEEGTGRALKQSSWRLAGKSGTAEVSLQGKARNHQWFIGYGPVDKPKYAVAVLVKNVRPHSRHQATALFGAVMDELAAYRRD